VVDSKVLYERRIEKKKKEVKVRKRVLDKPLTTNRVEKVGLLTLESNRKYRGFGRKVDLKRRLVVG